MSFAGDVIKEYLRTIVYLLFDIALFYHRIQTNYFRENLPSGDKQ